MNYKEFYMSLPVKDNNVKLLDGVVQGDNSNIINITLIDGDKPFDFTGYSDIMLSIEGPNDILIKSMVASTDAYNTDNPYRIQVASAKDGRISFNLNGLATSKEGTYYARFIVFAGSDILTTARLNYHVCKSDSNIPVSVYENSVEYTGLVNLTAQVSQINTEESLRVDAETWRKANEAERTAAELQRIETVREMTALWNNFAATLASVEASAAAAAASAEAAQNPTVAAISEILAGMNLPSDMAEMGALVAQYIGVYFSDGIHGDTTALMIKLLTAVTSLRAGEFAFDTDDNNLYIGTAGGNVCLTKPYIAGTVAPTNTNLLWIDTNSTPSLMKYFNGSSWSAVQTTAVFG